MHRDPYVLAAQAVLPSLDWCAHSPPGEYAAVAWVGPLRLALEPASRGYVALLGEGNHATRIHAWNLHDAAHALVDLLRAHADAANLAVPSAERQARARETAELSRRFSEAGPEDFSELCADLLVALRDRP